MPKLDRATKSAGYRWLGLLGAVFLSVGFLVTIPRASAEPGSESLASMLEARLGAPEEEEPRKEQPPEPGLPPMDAAGRMALTGLLVALAIFCVALFLKRRREGRLADTLASNLTVKESVWVGRGQRILLVSFEGHKVLVGVSNGALHNLGVFQEEAGHVLPDSPIEREAAQRNRMATPKSDFSDFVKGELASTLSEAASASKVGNGVNGVAKGGDPRQQMLRELNSL